MSSILKYIASFLGLNTIATQPVVSLTKDNYDTFLKENPLSLLKFYAPWCGHCKQLAPAYEKAAVELKMLNVTLAEINCDNEKEICQKNEIKGYPTLIVVQDGNNLKYEGDRTSDGIVNYMKILLRPLLTVVTSSNVDEVVKSSNVVALAYFDTEKGDDYEEFSSIASKYRTKVLFAVTTEKAVAGKYGLSAPGLVVVRKFDEPEVKFTGKFDATEVEAFITAQSVPLMDEIDGNNFASYWKMGLPLLYFFHTPADRDVVGPILTSIAKNYKGQINFVYIDSDKFGPHAEDLNMEKKFPGVVIHDISKDLKYPFTGKLEQAELTEYVKDFASGTLKPFFKSEPVPEKNDGPVKIVVGSEYEKIVNDPTKDVFLKIYAPWCGHCKNLAPVIEELAKKFSPEDNVVIAKMDLTANDLPQDVGYSVQGFPTLKLVKANTNEVVDYEGGRDLDSLYKFIVANGNNKITKKDEKEGEPAIEHDDL